MHKMQITSQDVHDLMMASRKKGRSGGGYEYTFEQARIIAATAGIIVPEDVDGTYRYKGGKPSLDFWDFWRAGKESLRRLGMYVYMGDKGDWAVGWTFSTPYRSHPGIRFEDDPPERPLY